MCVWGGGHRLARVTWNGRAANRNEPLSCSGIIEADDDDDDDNEDDINLYNDGDWKRKEAGRL